MADRPSEALIRQSYLEQAQLSQSHRWLAAQYDERVEHQDLLAPEAAYEANGVVANAAALQKTVRALKVDSIVAGGRRPVVEMVLVSDKGAEPVSAGTLQLQFADKDPTLPTISGVSLTTQTPTSRERPQTAPDRALPHRILALKHRWHALVESPEKTPSAFRDIIENDFAMDWGEGSVHGYEELAQWVTGSAARVSAARHDIAHFEWQSGKDGARAVFEFDWHGYSADNQRMGAKSRHTWQLRDCRSERYARLVRMDVQFLEPFHIVKGDRA